MRTLLVLSLVTTLLAPGACGSGSATGPLIAEDLGSGSDGVDDVRDAWGPDVTPDMFVPPDKGDAAPEVFDLQEQGGFGWPCETGDDCQSGFCIDGPEGKVCTTTCLTECPKDWTCEETSVGGPDVAYICLPPFRNLCRPCMGDDDCAGPGAGNSACVSFGPQGAFCAGDCSKKECPAGYTCQVADDFMRCLPDSGECQCTATYVAEGASTLCHVENDLGLCQGQRTCTQAGLSQCDAQVPIAEICNGQDDNCNGLADEETDGSPCEISNEHGICPGTTTCAGGVPKCNGEFPKPETCNGKDDNCDGFVDEGFADMDEDSLADCIDPDIDGDGLDNDADNCPLTPNPGQENFDLDSQGDVCDADDDNDGTADQADCQPLNAKVHPAAAEVCNGIDDNCDDVTDDGFLDTDNDGLTDCVDEDDDADGILDKDDNCPLTANQLQEDFDGDKQGDACDNDDDNDSDPDASDCEDYNAAVHHWAVELCDMADNNCNGQVDEVFSDLDKDGEADCLDDDDDGDTVPDLQDNCPVTPNPGQEDTDNDGTGDACEDDTDGDGDPDVTDCKDQDPDIHHGALEMCDGVDNNCNAIVDEGYKDTDGDSTADCLDEDDDGDGAPDDQDCQPLNPAVHPEATEVCNGLDDDCDEETDEGFVDSDSDALADCIDPDDDNDGDPDTTDCANLHPDIHHQATEACDGIDNDCDLLKDEEDADGCATWYLDNDSDGWGNSLFFKCLCGPTPQYAAQKDGDCLDTDPAVNPGKTESCDNKDNDCNQLTDEGCDDDGDQTCDFDMVVSGVVQVCPLGPGDCDDDDPTVFPGNLEECNGQDDNCNNLVDEGVKATFYQDSDQDGWGNAAVTTQACQLPDGYAILAGDCNDEDETSYPQAPELCDGADNNCNGLLDEGFVDTDADGLKNCVDSDDDNDGDPDQTDCAPLNPAIHSAVTEVCDGIDNNCSGMADEICGIAEEGWPMYRYDLRRTGHNMTVQGPAKATLKWEVKTGLVNGSPVVAPDDTVYVVGGNTLYSIDPADGSANWTVDLGGTGIPTVRKDGWLLVGGAKTLFLVDDQGEIRQTQNFPTAISTSPAVDSMGRIYVGTQSAMYCLNSEFQTVWSFPVPNGTYDVAMGLSGKLYFAGSSHIVYAIQPDGTLDWTYTHGNADTDSSVAIGEDGRIYQGFGSQVVALSPSGELIWQQSVAGDMDSNVAIFNTGFQCCNPTDYVLANPNGNTGVWSLSKSGATHFHTVLFAKDGSNNSTPVMDMDGDVYIGSSSSVFYSLTSAGALRWQYATHADPESTAAVADGVVYFGDDDGWLYAIGQ